MDYYSSIALVNLGALLLYQYVTFRVGMARGKYKVQAPATIGVHPDFDRAYRVQMNMLEQLIAFIPALWLFALFVSIKWATILGTIWLLARILYAFGYYREPKKRMIGFIIGMTMSATLIVGSLIGVISQFIA